MSCSTTDKEQSEFEYFQQSLKAKQPEQCVGILTQLTFTPEAYSSFNLACKTIPMDGDYLDRYDPIMLDSSHIQLTMCSKHWILHAKTFAAMGERFNSAPWKLLALHMFKAVCFLNNWDHKELFNFIKTADELIKKDLYE